MIATRIVRTLDVSAASADDENSLYAFGPGDAARRIALLPDDRAVPSQLLRASLDAR